jgi:hypothetical protein
MLKGTFFVLVFWNLMISYYGVHSPKDLSRQKDSISLLCEGTGRTDDRSVLNRKETLLMWLNFLTTPDTSETFGTVPIFTGHPNSKQGR